MMTVLTVLYYASIIGAAASLVMLWRSVRRVWRLFVGED